MPFQMGMEIPNDMIEGIRELIDRMARPGSQDLMRVEQSVRYGFAGNFARQAAGDSPPWAPLAPRTQRERAAQGYNSTSPILVRSGSYRESWLRLFPNGYRLMTYSADGWLMTVGSGDYRVEWLSNGVGARNLPPRPVHFLDNGQQNNIAAALDEMQQRVITALGL